MLICVSCSNYKKREVGYYNDGQIKYEVALKNNKREGELRKYFPDGKIQLISNWKNGLKDGEAKQFFPNGNVQIVQYYREGILEGINTKFDSTGNKIEKFYFSSGVKNGPYESYYSDGQLEVEAFYLDGLEHGNAIHYFPSGELKERMIFENGNKIYSVLYDKTGKGIESTLPISIKEIIDSKNGRKGINISLKKSFDENGKIGVLLGNLDGHYLLDTIAILESDSLSLNYYYDQNEFDHSNIVSGKVFDISHDNNILGYNQFSLQIKSN
jgi:antitoxin component YwqK of YwqJK toxin-antitoxin module